MRLRPKKTHVASESSFRRLFQGVCNECDPRNEEADMVRNEEAEMIGYDN